MAKRVNGEWRIASGARAFLFAIRHSLFACLLFIQPAFAQVQLANIAAHPALWTVHSKAATVFLLGSIHLLPANLSWHTPAIDRAMNDASTFVFEVPFDDKAKAEIADFIRRYGSLPQGTTLRSLLPPKTLKNYEHVLALAHVEPATLDGERPWLASIVLEVAYLQQMHYVVADGVDLQVFAFAQAHGRQVRTFETPEQQLRLFMPKDAKLELEEFDAQLDGFETEESTIGAIVDAWGAGDAKEVGRLMNKDLEKEPGARKILLDDRNKAWIEKLDGMLQESGTFFVTVGTGHLVGPKGVPALLRAQGYSVDGP